MTERTGPRLALAGLCVLGCAAFARADLVAHWRLDEDPPPTTDPDAIVDSGPEGSYHGTAAFAATAPIVFGAEGANDNTGTAADFANGAIHVPYDPDLNPESFTFAAWVRPDAAGGGTYRSVVTSRHDIGPNVDLRGFIIYNDAAGVWSFWTGDGDPGWAILDGPPVLVGEWQHLAIAFDAETRTKSFFVNGELVASTTSQGYRPNETMDFHIGAGSDAGNEWYFDGAIDDAALWDIALDEAQILDAMDLGAASVSENLVAHWPLDDAPGTSGPGSVKDATGHGFHGTPPRGAFELGETGATEKTGTSAYFRNAAIHVPYDEALNPDSFTVVLWAKPEAAGGGAYRSAITCRHDIGPNQDLRGYILYNDASGIWAFWTGDGDPNWVGVAGPAVIVGEWQHLAISFDAETQRKSLFFNGELFASTTSQRYKPNETMDLHIGAGGDAGNMFFFAGNLDDVALFARALSQDEIQCIMAEGAAAWETCLVPQPVPVVRSVEPSSGPVAGGTRVTITGENFQDGATVRFGGVPALDVIVVSPTEIACTAPARPAGTVAVEVRNPNGKVGALDAAFTYIGGPYFIRGDTDGNAVYTLGDGIQILERLFAGRTAYGSQCEETGDVDGGGTLTIGDAIYLFNYLFASGAAPAPPAPGCGTAEIRLGCARSTCTP